ncbi:DUF4834 family protein [Cyclobacteriaceae bacterium]|nr:DUF4834 family protein [Cyclobacteriaceae bacterium]
MGTFIKYVLIFIIVLYLINKVGKFFLQLFGGGQEKKTSRQTNSQSGQTDRVYVKDQSQKKFTAGEYVDYEEID